MGICGTDKKKTNTRNPELKDNPFSNNNNHSSNKKTRNRNNKDIQKNYNYNINQNVFFGENPISNNEKCPNTTFPTPTTNINTHDIQQKNIEGKANKNINESQIKNQKNENDIYPKLEDLKSGENKNKDIPKELIKSSVVPTIDINEKQNQNLDVLIQNENEKVKELIIEKQNKITKYDAIYSCESIKKLFDSGWNYTLFDSFIKRLQMDEDDKYFCPLCMIGETNKGKTFILNLLTNNQLESGIQYRTEGISCKFTSFNEDNDNEDETDKKFLLFDTAGRSEPLLIDPEIKKKFTEEDFKRTVETNNRDLKLSEDFMKNLLIRNSKIIIVVVNQLSLAEQLFLFELKNEENYEQLFIIHNIFNFKQREEIENYIDNTIINSIYFDLSKHYFDNYSENQNETDRPFYFTEELMKNGREQAIITHLILGDIESKDKWIKNFNDKTLDFLKSNMRVCEAKDFFDIGNILEKELINENIIDEKTKLIDSINDKTNVNINEEENLKGTLKLDNNKGSSETSEHDFVDNSNFNFMGFSPEYIHYKDEINSEFVIEVECTGIEDKDISITAKQKKGKVFFNIKGKKIFPEELKKSQPAKFNDKSFSINFSVNIEKEEITIDWSKETNEKKPSYENGIYKKGFPMKKAKKGTNVTTIDK